MSSYDFYVTVTQPMAYDLGTTIGLVELYLTRPYEYTGEAWMHFADGLAAGRQMREEYTAEELLEVAWDVEHERTRFHYATDMAALRYGN